MPPISGYEAPDEEALGFKLLNALLYHWKLRGVADPEVLHASWNCAKRAIKAAGLEGAALKGTLMANINHGYFLGGKNHQTKEEILQTLASKLDIADILDDVVFDRCLDASEQWDEETLLQEIQNWDTHRRSLNRGGLAVALVIVLLRSKLRLVRLPGFCCGACVWLSSCFLTQRLPC